MSGKYGSRGTIEERFWAKTERRGDDECWPWRGAFDGTGYGHFWINGRLQQAHRFSWELFNKQALPKDLYACHRCNVRGCVNPRHIYPDTQSGNIKYAVTCGRHRTPFRSSSERTTNG